MSEDIWCHFSLRQVLYRGGPQKDSAELWQKTIVSSLVFLAEVSSEACPSKKMPWTKSQLLFLVPFWQVPQAFCISVS